MNVLPKVRRRAAERNIAAESRTQRAAPSLLARAFAGAFMANATQKDTAKSSEIRVVLNP
jgi:hypothetical protein